MEYAIAKVCSVLEIGVVVGAPDHHFDLVCYKNCIEFYMEACDRVSDHHSLDIVDVADRLKYCVAVMHCFGLVHKDIKPDNILINGRKELILADFGLSTHVLAVPGQKSLAYREGTFSYMSPEMRSLISGRYGRVDLYYNDLYSLQASLEYIQKSCSRGSTPKFKSSRRHLDNKLTDLELEIIQLSQLITSGKSLQDKEMESKFAICFTSGYPGTMNLEFLIRSVGLSYLLIPYLSPIS